jgi:hypothetical protein
VDVLQVALTAFNPAAVAALATTTWTAATALMVV